MLELVDLECLVALADELHFGRAARRIGIGTPTLSKRLSDLERTLGVRLFDRTSRTVRLTAAGEVIHAQALRCLSEVEMLRQIAADTAVGRAGSIRLGYAPGTGELLGSLVQQLASRLPSLVVHPVQMISIKVSAAVESGEVLAGLVRVPPGANLATLVLTDAPINTLVIPNGHPLAALREVRLDDLRGETLLGPNRTVAPDDIYSSAHFRFHGADVTSEDELLSLVATGFGLLLTTEASMRRHPRTDVTFRPFVGWDRRAAELLVWRPSDQSPILRTLLDVAFTLDPVTAGAS